MKIALLQGKNTTSRVFHPSQLERLQRLGAELVINPQEGWMTAEQVADYVAGADVLITSWGCPPLDAALLNRAPGLRAVLHAAGSVKPVVTPELWRRGIRVSSAAAELSRGVGETALGLTLVTLKNLWEVTVESKTGGWWNRQSDGVRSRIREMYGVTIGCIGAGHAGRRYMSLLQPFHVEVLLADPTLTPEQAEQLGGRLVTLDELLTASDVVTVLAPELPSTYHMLNDRTLGLMKDDAILINLARGSLVDEEALVKHLECGRLFACLDVTEPEPPAPDHPFRTLPNVLLTGHIAGAVNNGLYALGHFVVDELQRLLNGEPLEGEVREEQLHLMA
ncbi:2-hydroxyacid dehydrogenase [Paenibacillus sp. J31TS4]|uniref:hydroxyacid dehydrogenase n=1 Tax=Paenibacillus sp. J31TS4 TaxID=2807195 RepID=UPI001B08D596|nr:hydroxyacid dehydrogenase [Paenibacillus sp. J31TS4]GIP37775.1 2-hydroxyacid dehydrogenase [Paenibacillus sp. J31TS4]